MSAYRLLALRLLPLFFGVIGPQWAFAQSQVQVKWRVNGVTESHTVRLGEAGHPVTLTSIHTIATPRLQVQCSRESAPPSFAQPEEGIRLVMTPYVSPSGESLLQVVFDYQKFLGVEQHEVSPGCLVSSGKSMRLNESSTVVLKPGKPIEVFKETTQNKEASGYSVTVELQ